MTIEVLDPTFDEASERFESSTRLDEPAGRTIGIVSNGKRGTLGLFDALETEPSERHRVEEVSATDEQLTSPARVAAGDIAAFLTSTDSPGDRR